MSAFTPTPSRPAGTTRRTGVRLLHLAAVTALVVSVWLLLRDRPLPWLAGAAIMAGTLAAILLAHTGSGLPALGPMPALKEEGYDLPQLVTMAAEAAYLVLAAVRLASGRSRRP